jgi:hypothetical protein
MSRQSSLTATGRAAAGDGRLGTVVLLVLAITAGIVLAGAGVLWLHYGTAVFFQILAAGLAACF